MKVERSALLQYSAPQIYAVINDVAAYPSFLNWCDSVAVLEEYNNRQVAELGIAYGKLKFAFVTENTLVPNEGIQMQLVSGPFKQLSGQWVIQTLNESACKVSLSMDFTFDNPITHRLFRHLFQSVISAQVDAFHQRAQDIYGA